jgi:hypothetical protein
MTTDAFAAQFDAVVEIAPDGSWNPQRSGASAGMIPNLEGKSVGATERSVRRPGPASWRRG